MNSPLDASALRSHHGEEVLPTIALEEWRWETAKIKA
jgi:hypothetical protein